MAYDAYLKIDGIEGESSEDKHKRWIELTSFNFGGAATGAADFGSGLASGKVAMQDFHFTKRMDVCSPKVMEACCAGKTYKFADLELCRSTGEKVVYLKVHFDELIISSYQTGGAAGDGGMPSEQISFNFTKVNYSYIPLDSMGRPQGALQAGYDIKQQTKI